MSKAVELAKEMILKAAKEYEYFVAKPMEGTITQIQKEIKGFLDSAPSIETLRKAMDELIEEGIVEKTQISKTRFSYKVNL